MESRTKESHKFRTQIALIIKKYRSPVDPLSVEVFARENKEKPKKSQQAEATAGEGCRVEVKIAFRCDFSDLAGSVGAVIK